MDTSRRSFLTSAGAVAAGSMLNAQEPVDDHKHQTVPSDPTLRVKALESLLVDKGLVDPEALDALIDASSAKLASATERALWRGPGWIPRIRKASWPMLPPP